MSTQPFLERVGADPISLMPGEPFTVGRVPGNSLTVPSARVSRKHAEIGWDGARAILKDLGSQNGTQVNGKRIRGEYALKDGDELEFGPFMCTYRSSTDAAGEGGEDLNALTRPMLGDSMAGRLDQINLVELLQTLEFNQKSGTLEVFGVDGEGTIVVKEGSPTFAEADGLAGEEAIYKLLKFKSGQFNLSPDVQEEERNVHKPMGGILMEAMRQIDEG